MAALVMFWCRRQGHATGALAAYKAGLIIAEGLAKRDSSNTQWQADVAVSCAKLGSLDSFQSIQQRQEYISRGFNLLTALKQVGRLNANQNWTGLFNDALSSLKYIEPMSMHRQRNSEQALRVDRPPSTLSCASLRWSGFSGQPPSLTSEAGHRP
jgi:hypothetical protein